jgi:O-antigen/teichoic acid export membrane protein
MRDWLRSSLVWNASKLMSGRLGAMGLALLAAPIIARLFTPEDYGVAALFLAIATVAAGIIPAGFHRAILFPRDDSTAARLLILTVACCALGSLLLGLVLAAASSFHSTGLLADLLAAGVLWLLPVVAFALAVRDALHAVLLRRSAFSSMAWIEMTQSGVILSARMGWGLLLGSSAVGLVLGHLVGLLATLVLGAFLCRAWIAGSLAGVSSFALVPLAAEFKDYPRYRVLARLALTLANQLPILAIGYMYPPAVVGFFAMADRAAGIPLLTASQALSDAVLGNSIRQRHRNHALGPAIRNAALLLLATGLPTFAILFMFGGEVLTWLLGSRWFEAGEMLEIMSVYFFFQWIASAFSSVPEALRRNRLQMVLNWLNLAARALTFASCFALDFDVYESLWAFSAVSCLHQVLVIATAIHAIRTHDRRISS